MEYATALDIGKRKRERGGINEDAVAVTLFDEGYRDTGRRAGVFVLADGAGGSQAGDVASYVTTVEVSRRLTRWLWGERRFVESVETGDDPEAAAQAVGEQLVREPLSALPEAEIHDAIADAIQAAHRTLLERIDELALDNAYSTVVAGVKAGDRLHYGWVGDSRAYVVNTAEGRDDDQRVCRLTQDHSVVERLLEEGQIDEVEANVHRHGNRLTRALGGARTQDPAADTVGVETNSVRLFGDDVVLFTSDGLIDAYVGAGQLHERYRRAEDTDEVERAILQKSVTDDEISDVVLAADSLETAAARFVELSNERGGKDNVSLILFRDDSLPASPAGGLPLRVYDPEPDVVSGWKTVIQRAGVSESSGETDAGTDGAGSEAHGDRREN